MRTYAYIGLKKVPAARLLLAFITGIVIAWYGDISLNTIVGAGIAIITAIAGFFFLPAYKKFTLRWLQGTLFLLLFAVAGAVLTYINNAAHQQDWFQKYYTKGSILIATLDEPLMEKPKTYKAVARITAIQTNHALRQVTGAVIIYLKKDSAAATLTYGSQIAFAKPLQTIQNTGNPGSFDYRRYLLFQGVTDQVYLQPGDYAVLSRKAVSPFRVMLQQARTYVITALQTYIPGKKEQGVAEALLIGYRNDLDKQLVQSYSNTGVVHIIAISGLHLGMIYAALLWLLSPFKNRRGYRFVMPAIVLLVLWAFTFIAGAVPSIVRSAVMFSFIVAGECLQRKTNIYNTLAASALCLLLYNPFYLWDVGFQLSYAAVLSIVVFMKPVYNLLYVENTILDTIWKLVATNMAAQVFTLPLVLFYFHQFPLLFLLTNLVVVPLSTIILFVEIAIVFTASWFAWLAGITGWLSNRLLELMNGFVEYIEQFPFALWRNIKTDFLQAALLYILILLLVWWVFTKTSKALLYALSCVLVFITYTSIDIIKAARQHKLIVYNVPKQTAIDIIQGYNCRSLMQSALLHDNLMQQFYINPARLNCRVQAVRPDECMANNYAVHAGNKTIIIVGRATAALSFLRKLQADAIIITGNPQLNIEELQWQGMQPVIIFDSSNALWKIEQWKKECNRLHLRFHSVAQQGAFVMDI